MFNRLEKIFEHTPHPYAVFSADGKLIFQNKVFESFNEVQIKENHYKEQNSLHYFHN